MPYKDKAMQREAVKEAVKKHRKGITTGSITSEGITDFKLSDVVSPSAEAGEGITQYPPIVYALADPIKRKKLNDICKALSHRNLQSRLYFGAGKYAIDFDTVEQLLEVTNAK